MTNQLMPQQGKQELAMNIEVDVLIYGGAAGSGKSRLLLLKAAHCAYRDSHFEAVAFRRTTNPLKAAGGLFTEAKKLYSPLKPKIRDRDMEIFFTKTGGGNLKFTHLEHEHTAEANHQGLQYSAVLFDELTHFYQSQFLYLIGRLRSEAKGNSFCMATTNPDMDSWVLDWVRWYLDDEGYFDESKLGVIRYFLIVDDKPVFGDSEKELADLYPDLCYQEDSITNEMRYVPPLSYCFIGGTIFDNPALIKANPKYLSALKAQSDVNRRRLLNGCWFARAEGSNYFQREWLNKLDKVPLGCKEVRAYDLASTEPSEKNRYPDFTASVKMLKDSNNNIIIVGDYTEESIDKNTQIGGKFRKRPGERDRMMLNQAKLDGEDCTIVIPKDPGAGGETAFRELSKFFNSHGFIVKKDPAPVNVKKLKRFEPFSSACQNGLVSIVESSFPNKTTLEAFYKELESFDGERSTTTRKDDIPDAAASCYNYLVSEKTIKPFSIPQINAPTILATK